MKVFIIDDQRLYADGIQNLLENHDQNIRTDYSSNTADAYKKIINGDTPDLIILGVNDSASSANYDLIESINKLNLQIPVIISSASNSPVAIAKAIENNASGFISKYFNPDTTLKSILSVLDGDMYFRISKQQLSNDTKEHAVDLGADNVTSRQLDVLLLLSQGLLNKQIASELNISANTVKVHLNDIFKKLHVTNRTAAVSNGRKYGLI